MKRSTLKRPAPSPAAKQVDAITTRAIVPVVEAKPTHAQIQARAFELFESRRKAGRGGTAELDWIEAERELCARNAPATRVG